MPNSAAFTAPVVAPVAAPTYAGAEGFVTPSWVDNARQTIGTGVEPVYPKKLGGHGGDTLIDDTSKAPIGYRYDNGKSEYVYLDLAGKPTGQVENRGNGIFGQVTDMAKTLAPLAIAALGANYLPGLLSGAEGGGGGLIEGLTGGGGAGTSINEMIASGLAPGSAGAAGAASGLLTGSELAVAAGLSGTAATTLASTLGAGAGSVLNAEQIASLGGADIAGLSNTAAANLASSVAGGMPALQAAAAAGAGGLLTGGAGGASVNEMVASGTAPGSAGAAGAAAGALTPAELAAATGTVTSGSLLSGLGGTSLLSSITNPLAALASSAVSALNTAGVGGLVTAALPAIAGVVQGNSAADAARIQADAITKAAQTAADAAKFKPVGVTTAFGSSNFGYDANGNLTSAGYQLTPELAAQRDAILKAAGTTGMDWMKNTQTAGQGLFNLGQSYIAKTPEQAAAEWMAAQQKVLQPAQDTAYARMQQNLANTGRGGLSIAQGTGMGAANPEAQAYYNALAQQNNQLAAQAQAEGRAATTFGQGLLTGGLDLVSQGYNPYKTQFGTAQSVEQAGQNALDIGSALGGRAATAGANAGNTLYQGAVAASGPTAKANAYNPYADLLAGAAKAPTIADFLQTWINKV